MLSGIAASFLPIPGPANPATVLGPGITNSSAIFGPGGSITTPQTPQGPPGSTSIIPGLIAAAGVVGVIGTGILVSGMGSEYDLGFNEGREVGRKDGQREGTLDAQKEVNKMLFILDNLNGGRKNDSGGARN